MQPVEYHFNIISMHSVTALWGLVIANDKSSSILKCMCIITKLCSFIQSFNLVKYSVKNICTSVYQGPLSFNLSHLFSCSFPSTVNSIVNCISDKSLWLRKCCSILYNRGIVSMCRL